MTATEYFDLICGKYKQSFENFRNLLTEYNNKFNLTAICDENGIYIKHFLDSVMGECLFDNGARVVEIGSGGGFPSIPLKIVRDDLSFTLVESTAKKCGYLQVVVDKLGFKGVEVVNERAEIAARQVVHREKYDVAEARAVARLNTLCEYCLPFVKVGGKFIAYKGDNDEEFKEAENAVKILGGRLEEIRKYELPDGEKRALVVIEKVKPTPPKYPRGQGKERKSPLR